MTGQLLGDRALSLTQDSALTHSLQHSALTRGLQDSTLTDGLQCWQNEWLQNVISVASAGHILLDTVQRCRVAQFEATPHHDRPAAVAIVLHLTHRRRGSVVLDVARLQLLCRSRTDRVTGDSSM